jgi:hypothetical protein
MERGYDSANTTTMKTSWRLGLIHWGSSNTNDNQKLLILPKDIEPLILPQEEETIILMKMDLQL